MPFGIAETIAFISAAMQAIDFYAKHGGSREQVIQTLNLEYRPTQYQHVEKEVLNLGREFSDLFAAVGESVRKCFEDFKEAIRDFSEKYFRSTYIN